MPAAVRPLPPYSCTVPPRPAPHRTTPPRGTTGRTATRPRCASCWPPWSNTRRGTSATSCRCSRSPSTSTSACLCASTPQVGAPGGGCTRGSGCIRGGGCTRGGGWVRGGAGLLAGLGCLFLPLLRLHPLTHPPHPPLTGPPTAPVPAPLLAAAEVKNSATRLGYVWQSTGCDSFYWQRVGRRIAKGNTTNYKYTPGAVRFFGE